MPRTRIRGDQAQDISFVSEEELNQFFGKTVITGTVDDTIVLEDFNTYFPGRGLIIEEGGVTVTTGTNFVSISGGDASVVQIDDLQDQIDVLSFSQAGVGSITTSGVTLSGALTFEGLGTVSLSADGQTITFSGSGSDVTSAITDINGEVGPSITLQGAGEVSVSSTATNEITISGTPHTENTDTISDAIIGVGTVVVTSGVDTTTISGTPHTVNTDTISNALIAGHGITITSGTSTTVIDSFDDNDVDSLTASGTTVTGSIQLASLGGIAITADAGTDTVTISGGPVVGDVLGNFFQVEFTSIGVTNNSWLSVSSRDLASNITPWPALFPCRIAGLVFSNERSGADADLELHVAREGDGATNVIEFTWEVRNARVTYKSDFSITDIVLAPGDKLGIFSSNAGSTRPKNMFLGVYVEVTAVESNEAVEDFSGNLT